MNGMKLNEMFVRISLLDRTRVAVSELVFSEQQLWLEFVCVCHCGPQSGHQAHDGYEQH